MANEAAQLASESERRQATVLFADISGFTSIAEKMDPEEVTAIVNHCLSMLAGVVGAHGGRVDKYIGDCIMAVFGVPALENAPQHAINAAIEMCNQVARLNLEQRVSVPLNLHIGVNTGLVIAGRIGGDVKQEFTVIGDPVNVAARLKDAAKSGTIYVGLETYRYTREDFEFRKLPPIALKGKEHPVEGYEVLSRAEQLHRPRPGGSDRIIVSPLVGRERELTLLKTWVARLKEGRGGIINLIGEAGLGKSRLLAEFVASEECADVMVLEGRSLSTGQGLSFHPFVDLVAHWAGIHPGDDERQSRNKLEASIGSLFPAEGGEIFPFVATLMGMRLTGVHAARVEGIAGEALERLILKSMRLLLQRMAEVKPLVLIFEDLHSADLSSIQLLENLLRLVPDHRILFIHAFRPDHPHTSERILRAAREHCGPHSTEIVLQPLDDPECTTLIRNLLKTEDLAYSTLALIARTAEGNPFYIEEVVRALIDAGALEYAKGRLRATERVDAVVIPDTIQGVIMARVDCLAEPTRNVLQAASVLGRSFYARVLAAVVAPGTDLDAELVRLKERQLLFERTTRRTSSMLRATLSEEVQYVFKHALVQETVYESMLQKKRRALHLRVAETIEEIFADRITDFSSMLAYHFSRAEHLEKAEEYLFKAGDDAARAAASSEALAFFREASRLYFMMHPDGGDPKKKALLKKNIALALLNTGDLTESIEHFDAALEHLGERVAKGTLAAGAAFALNLTALLGQLYGGLRKRRDVTDWETERQVCEILFNRARAQSTSDPTRFFFDSVAALRRFNQIDATQIDQASAIYASGAGMFCWSGFSFALSRRTLAIAKRLIRPGNVKDAFTCASMEFIHHYAAGDWSDTYLVDERLLEAALRQGQLWDVNTYLGLLCDQRLRQGDFAGARALLEQLADISKSYGYAFAGTNHDGQLAVLLLEERKLREALQAIDVYHSARHEDALRVFGLGTRAKIQVLLGDDAGALATLTAVEKITSRSRVVSPWHLSPYAAARLRRDVVMLERLHTQAGATSGQLCRRARRSAAYALRVAERAAPLRVEILQLAGHASWLRGDRRRALVYWNKSVEEGARLRARPELARTYAEAGRRLVELAAARETVGGLDAAGCMAKARELFVEIGLERESEQPQRVGRAA
jgi:class 3 adenylate cyclase/tetratricopeptide (TPR) repeat protein